MLLRVSKSGGSLYRLQCFGEATDAVVLRHLRSVSGQDFCIEETRCCMWPKLADLDLLADPRNIGTKPFGQFTDRVFITREEHPLSNLLRFDQAGPLELGQMA